MAAFQVIDVVRIGGKLRVIARRRSVGQRPRRTASAAASARWRRSASATPAGLFFQRIEVQICLSACHAVIQQVFAVRTDYRVTHREPRRVQCGQAFADVVELELHFDRRFRLGHGRAAAFPSAGSRPQRWPARPCRRARAVRA